MYFSWSLIREEHITEKVREMDIELVRWVQFGLSSSQSGLYPENSHLVMIGCSLVKHLSLMHDRQLSASFCVSSI